MAPKKNSTSICKHLRAKESSEGHREIQETLCDPPFLSVALCGLKNLNEKDGRMLFKLPDAQERLLFSI